LRRYIFTERERRILEEWLKTGEENQKTRNAFCMIRRNVPSLNRDLRLMLEAVRELKKRDRWSGRVTEAGEFGSAFRLAESGLTRLRRERTT
jgi:hypothetical protein